MRSSKMTPFQTHMDMSENRIPQNLMVYHGLSWFIMVYHGLSWFIAIFPMKIDWNHGNLWLCPRLKRHQTTPQPSPGSPAVQRSHPKQCLEWCWLRSPFRPPPNPHPWAVGRAVSSCHRRSRKGNNKTSGYLYHIYIHNIIIYIYVYYIYIISLYIYIYMCVCIVCIHNIIIYMCVYYIYT